ncbi:MAG: undecaprenyl phosphate translocase family protein, partial [Alcanivorax nanhaiticus]
MIQPGIFFRGMAMGAADVVPGVSGGTLALITGIYEELIDTLGGFTPRLL